MNNAEMEKQTSQLGVEAAQVQVIPATKRWVQAGGQLRCQRGLRVAAYCRVSTGDESQQTSYTKQKEYYTDLINGKEGWIMAGIFADEGISGASTRHRKEFRRMMKLALEGGIDYIVTKSISRFARNTVDTLSCVRRLQERNPPVGVYFEKENIDTLDAKGELILTILSALAQEELRSLSDNIRWTIQKNFQDGKAHLNPSRIYGYAKGPGGEWVPQPEQAEVVQRIFESYLAGNSATQIARQLNAEGRLTRLGKAWRCDAVLYVLRNEKYVGDCEMQKYVTESYLTHKTMVNDGQAPRIYFTNHHPPLVDRNTWDAVQLMLDGQNVGGRMKGEAGRRTKRFVAFGNLRCGCCGGRMVKRSFNGVARGYSDERSEGLDPSREKESYYFGYGVWRCENAVRKKHSGKKTEEGTEEKTKEKEGEKRKPGFCEAASTYEIVLRQSFMELLYRLKREYEEQGQQCPLARSFRDAVARQLANNREFAYHLEKCRDYQQELAELEQERRELAQRREELVGQGERAAELAIYGELLAEVEGRQKEIRNRWKEEELGDGTVTCMQKNYELFLSCLEALPETNEAGMPLRVNGRDEGVPDLLRFDRGMYVAFVEAGEIRGNRVFLRTIFGLELVMENVDRTLGSFLGARKTDASGCVEYVTRRYQVAERKIGYVRKPR